MVRRTLVSNSSLGGGLRLSTHSFTGGIMPKKVDDIVAALKRDHPDWSDSKIYAIANAAYNKMQKG